MKKSEKPRAQEAISKAPGVASELNNLIQIISGTSELIENIWEGTEGSDKYFEMLRASIARAEQVTAELVAQWGGANGKIILQPSLKRAVEVVPTRQALPRPSILVVDDEPMVLSLFRRVLSEGGYKLTCAQSGFECLDLFRRDVSAYDLVLLDLAMPLMDGEETFQRLRGISDRIAVVLTTGFCEEERLARMMKLGLAGYLRKPLRNKEILALVGSVIKASKAGTYINSSNGIAAAFQQT